MIDVSFELRGKKIMLEDMEEIERQALITVAHNVANALASVKCAEHGMTPEVVVRGDDVRHLEFRVRGCCVTLINEAMDQLREAAPRAWWERNSIPREPWHEG